MEDDQLRRLVQEGADAFGKLPRFFRPTNSGVFEALGWPFDTVRLWVRGWGYPSIRKCRQVKYLVELCEEASAYLDSDYEAGDWVNNYWNRIGTTPAEFVREHSYTGLIELKNTMIFCFYDSLKN